MDARDDVGDEMLDLADRLSGLDDEQWNAPSLCALWRIRDVLAHVTAGAEGAFGVAAVCGGLLRHGFRYDRWVAADGRRRGEQDPAITLTALRNSARRRSGSEGRSITALAHVLVHGQDMCRPLGITRDLPAAHLIPVADFVASSFIFRAKRRIAGVRLTAIDMDWSHGEGPEVVGPVEALVMVMAGRTVALDDLWGEGKRALASDH